MARPRRAAERMGEMSNVQVEGITVISSTLPPMAANMTLHDWYAGMAMQGMLSASENYQTIELAKYAFDVADAMMAARKK
jgi:hypothetical protein